MEQTVNGAKTSRFCASCGEAAGTGAAFCASCGNALGTPATPAPSTVAPARRVRNRRSPDRRLLIAGAVVAAIALVAALVLTRGGSEGPSFDGERAVVDASRAITVTTADLDDAETIAKLQAAGADAGERAEDLDAPIAEVDRLDDAVERRATRQALDASQTLLSGYAGLADLGPENLDRWPSVRAELTEAGEALTAADRVLVAADLPGIAPAALAGTTGVVDDVSRLVEAAQAKLGEWTAESDRIQGERTFRLAALAGYEQAFRGHDARYVELRRDLQDFVDRVDANGVSYGEAYSTLSQATAQREEIRNALRALTPPPALAATHAGLVDVLDEAIGAMRSASEGVRQYEYSWEYWYYKDTPGWQTFMSASSSITGAHDTAFRAWEGAVAAERVSVEAMAPPPPPAV